MIRLFFIFFFLMADFCSAQKLSGNTSTELQLFTLEQKVFSIDQIKNNLASVFIFLLSDCPACESYSLTLNKLNNQFKTSGIRFYGVFPGHYNTEEEMKGYQSKYRINFLLMTDPDKKLVKKLGAKIAPEVFVLNNTAQTVYRGRIDDWLYAVGKKRLKVTSHELQNALNEIVEKKVVKVSATNAIGCIIE